MATVHGTSNTETLPAPPPTHLVSIVGSMGSLDPLLAIVPELTPGLDAAVVVLIHRAPKHKTYLEELLSRATSLSVGTFTDGAPLERGRIYVVPSGDRHAYVDARSLHLVNGPRIGFQRPSGDPLLRSAAAAFGPAAVAVILSGLGHNGTGGVAEIERAGGKVLVQSLAEAAQTEMPEHALRTVAPDLCAPAAQLGRRVLELCSDGRTAR